MPPKSKNYPQFVAWLRQLALDFDVAVAPLLGDDWSAAKSDLKFLESTALGLAVVASDSEPYRESIEDEVSGLLVGEAPEQWADALERLALDDGLRMKLVRNATSFLETRFLSGQRASTTDMLYQLGRS